MLDKELPDNVVMFPGGESRGISQDTDETVPISMDDDEPVKAKSESTSHNFNGNLAEKISPQTLVGLGLDLNAMVEEDKRSRDRWMRQYKKSLKYLGIEEEVRMQPWANACGVTYPGMLQGIVRFQSRALGKLFPQQGPCAIGVVGCPKSPKLQTLINQTQEKFNLHLTKNMPEFQTETDKSLFGLAFVGFVGHKVFFEDDQLVRTTVSNVEAEDLILPYGTTSLECAPRYTHELRITRNSFRNMVIDKRYLDVPEGSVGNQIEDVDELREAKDRTVGQDPEQGFVDDAFRLYEIYIDKLFPEDEFGRQDKKRAPYVVTIDKSTSKVLAIRRNWREDDNKYKKKVPFSLYRYVPGFDTSYAFGLLHLTVQLIIAATRILRQLVDAGELANLPAILKSNAARMDSQAPLSPGELRDVSLSPEELQKAFFPLPFKEPSQSLIKLLEIIIAEIKSFSSTADLDISASSQNAPVGTTLALLERQTEISNAVQKRLHASFGQELQLIKDSMQENEKEIHDAIFAELEGAVQSLKGVLVLYANGDPNSSTMAQMVMQIQAIIQASTQAPQVYDLAMVHRMLVTAMGISNAELIVPDKSQVPEQGIVEENGAIINGQPVKAFPDQDHEAHIGGHMAWINDQLNSAMMEQDPSYKQKMFAGMAHVCEHIALKYRNEIQQQMGTALPTQGNGPQDPQIENALSQLVSEAAARVQQLHASQAAKQAAQAQAADPAFALEQRELDIKDMDTKAKHTIQAGKLKLAEDNDKRKQDNEAEKNKLEMLRIVTEAIKHAGTLTNQESEQASNLETTSQGLAKDLGTTLLDHAATLNDHDQQNADRQHEATQADMDRQQELNSQGIKQAHESRENAKDRTHQAMESAKQKEHDSEQQQNEFDNAPEPAAPSGE